MPQDNEEEPKISPGASLASRAERYRDEVEKVVTTVGEHPLYELKKRCDLSHLFQKIEFVKDVQSIATSRIVSERYLVIGADETTRTFTPVTNPDQFDEAKIRQILEKYLDPTPQFEIFRLTTAKDTIPFVLLVIGKQKTRRILARETVELSADLKPKALIREGDLWTKGDSTGKRLAGPEDWDDIYEEFVERESESRTRNRTDHLMQKVVAQERLRLSSGMIAAVPAYLSDEEFKMMAEAICVENDASRLWVLLERLRDDLIEGWHSCGAYDAKPIHNDPRLISSLRTAARQYRDDRFRPALQRLTLLGIVIVKNGGAIPFFEQVLELIRETYLLSHRLQGLRLATTPSTKSKHLDDHISHTTVALESLLSTYCFGAYITKRRRFDYFRSLLNQPVHPVSRQTEFENKQSLLAMWPLPSGYGEPEQLHRRAGRIDLCAFKITTDPVLAVLFGSEESAREALMQFELLVEWNSFLAVDTANTPATVAHMQRAYPQINFDFRSSLIAFDLAYLTGLVVELYASIEAKLGLVNKLVFAPALMNILGDETLAIFLKCLQTVEADHERLMDELNRFGGFGSPWPKRIQEALRALPPRKG